MLCIHSAPSLPTNLMIITHNYDSLFLSIMYSKTPLNLLVPCNNGFKTIDDTNVLTRHFSDYHMCDDEIQWWSLCHAFKRYLNIIPIYGDRILISPSSTHISSNKFILWSNSIPFKSIDIFIHGLFSFDTKIDIIKPHQFIIKTRLDYLLNVRVPLGFTYPSYMIQITQVSVKIILRVKKENILLIYLLRMHFYSYVTTQIQQKNKIYFL